MRYIIYFFSFFLLLPPLRAGEAINFRVVDSTKLGFFSPATKPNPWRYGFLTGGTVAAYSATVVGLNQAWYAGYPRSSFHFFNDWNGWRQMDKFGHAFTAYFESKWVGDMYAWAGIGDKKAAWIGAGAGMVFQTSLELLDAFSAEWGFSVGDMAFNTMGSGLYLSQALLWGEQRILLKMSSHRPNYSSAPIRATNSHEISSAAARAQNLFGTSFPELLFKEYNGQTLWLSGNVSAFLPKSSRFPRWLNVAVGYGIENVLGAERNSWTNANGSIFVAPMPPRMSQFYLSLDIDFERIPTRRPWLRSLFKVLNIFKIPFPTLELNSLGGLKLRPFYF